MHHYNRRLLCALLLSLTGFNTRTSCAQLTVTPQDVHDLILATEITNSNDTYLFIGSELSPLPELIETIAPLATENDNIAAITTVRNRLSKGRKTAPKKLIIHALGQLVYLLENQHQAIADDNKVQTLVEKLTTCTELVNTGALTITDNPNTLNERAPRPSLQPGGQTDSIGSPNPAPEIISNPVSFFDLNIAHNLFVGNNATIVHNLTVEGEATFTGPLTTPESAFLGTTTGGLHVGGLTEPGDNNLLVDGTSTFTGPLMADGGIDVTEGGLTDTLNLGTSNANLIILGNSTSTTTLKGTTDIADKLITLNKTGAALSAHNAGIEVEEAGIPTGFVKTSATRDSWTFKAPNTAGTATLTPSAGGFTFNQPLGTADSPSFMGWTNANQGQLHLRESLINGTNQVSIQAPGSLTGNYLLTLPSDAGTSGYILTTAGPSGLLSWTTFGTTDSIYKNNGNTFSGASPAIIGTRDNKTLALITNSADRITISNTARLSVVSGMGEFGLNANLYLAATTLINKNSNKFIHTSGGTGNLFAGPLAGNAITSGSQNTGIGDSALLVNTSGTDNTAAGYHALLSTTTAHELTAVGSQALDACTTGLANTAIGFNALSAVTTGANNSAFGHNALASSTGSSNTGCGTSALSNASFTGSDNTVLGSNAGSALTSGNNNIIIGKNAGSAYTSSESNNICIGCAGITGAGGTACIGSIRDTNIILDSEFVSVSVDGKLGSIPVDNLTLDGAANFTGNTIFTKDRIQTYQTTLFYGTSPNPFPTYSQPYYLGTYYTNAAAAPFGSTNADRLNFGFNYCEIPSIPSNYVLNPAYGTVQMTVGSNAANNSGTFVIGTGGVNTPPISRFEVQQTGKITLASSNQITLNSTRYISQKNNSSFYMGLGSGPAGAGSTGNTGIGTDALKSLTGGTNNTAIGYNAGSALTSGSNNTLIGVNAGLTYTNESNNICIGYDVQGTASDQNVIRIGNANQTECIFFTNLNDGTYVKALHPAGSVAPVVGPSTKPVRVSMVNIDVLGNLVAGTTDITGVVRVPDRPNGAWRIYYNAFTNVPVVVANSKLPVGGSGIWNEWTVMGDITTTYADVFTFDRFGSGQDRAVNAFIVEYN